MRQKTALLITMAAALVVLTAWPAAASTGWVLQSTPNPSGTTLAELNGVSCTSATFCITVGDAEPTGIVTFVAVAEQWNGSTWTLQSPVSPAGAELSGVSCTSSTSCEAVGSDNAGALAEYWNGTTWSAQAIPGTSMEAVSCVSSTSCEAVGIESADYWNGTSWASQAITTPAGSGLGSVSCSSASSCTAIGTSYNSATSSYSGLAERWDGSTWSTQTFVQAGSDTEPFGVSCPSATSCIAVGYYISGRGNVSSPLAEYWNGTGWATQAVASTSDPTLYAVSCASAAICTASGTTQALGTAAESWNGSTWTQQTTPNPSGTENSSFSGISCPTTTDCTAVGDWYKTLPDIKTLAEQWTG
jgi:hypothetical protein